MSLGRVLKHPWSSELPLGQGVLPPTADQEYVRPQPPEKPLQSLRWTERADAKHSVDF